VHLDHRGNGRSDRSEPEPWKLARVACATLALAGEDDPITPMGDTEDIVAALPAGQVRFERFATAGHGVRRDAPEAAFRVIRDFLGDGAEAL
jgi:proline iminopeptidase